MQHHIPLQDIPHTICCLALTLSYQLISFFLLDKKIQSVTMESGLLFTRIVYVMLISKHKTSLEQKLHCESKFDRHRNVKPDDIPIGKSVHP